MPEAHCTTARPPSVSAIVDVGMKESASAVLPVAIAIVAVVATAYPAASSTTARTALIVTPTRELAEGRFKNSVIPVKDINGQVVLDNDEFIRAGTTVESLGKLKPSFAAMGEMGGFDAVALQKYHWVEKINHVHHAGNSSGIVDGASAVLIGNEKGGSGKSIFAAATKHCQTLFDVDGKTADLKNDRFIYHGVDERTREILFDDVRVNFDFELLFSQITNKIRVKPFQGAPIDITAPVFTITTNHAIRGDDTSTRRRQYLLAFCNFFNEHRTPRHFFGHQLFYDWDKTQWNLYYNLMATALQVYMQHSDLGQYGIESGDIQRRKLRQQIGEDFLEFADTYFTAGYMLNRVVVKERVLNDYLSQFPHDRKFMDVRRIKEKCELFARYASLDYNPTAKGPDNRIKSSGFEFICLADKDFNAATADDKVYINTSVEKTAHAPY